MINCAVSLLPFGRIYQIRNQAPKLSKDELYSFLMSRLVGTVLAGDYVYLPSPDSASATHSMTC